MKYIVNGPSPFDEQWVIGKSGTFSEVYKYNFFVYEDKVWCRTCVDNLAGLYGDRRKIRKFAEDTPIYHTSKRKPIGIGCFETFGI